MLARIITALRADIRLHAHPHSCFCLHVFMRQCLMRNECKRAHNHSSIIFDLETMKESLFVRPNDGEVINDLANMCRDQPSIELMNLLLRIPPMHGELLSEEESVIRINEILVTEPLYGSFDYRKIIYILDECTSERFRQKHVLNIYHEFLDFVHCSRGQFSMKPKLPKKIVNHLFFLFTHLLFDGSICNDGLAKQSFVILNTVLQESGLCLDGLHRHCSQNNINVWKVFSTSVGGIWRDIMYASSYHTHPEHNYIDEFIDNMKRYDRNHTDLSYYNDIYADIINYLVLTDKKDTLNKMFLELDMSDILMNCAENSVYFTPEFYHKLINQDTFNEEALDACISDVYMEQYYNS